MCCDQKKLENMFCTVFATRTYPLNYILKLMTSIGH